MIDAALKVVSDEAMPLRYQSDNEGKLLILKALNYYEAHDDYAWPDFTVLGFDFANNMRLRRALVHDVYIALERSGRLQLGHQQVVTPSRSSDRGRKRTVPGGEYYLILHRHALKRSIQVLIMLLASMTKAKQCGKKQKTEHNDGDDDAASNTNDNLFGHDSNFLAETMHLLIDRSEVDVEIYLIGEKNPRALADVVHDGLVNVWDRPLAGWFNVPHGTANKSAALAVYTRKIDATPVDSDGDSTASVIEELKKRQGRETSIELGDRELSCLSHGIL